jgi:quercetin dioxygenase-like cupin family protein
MHIEPIRLQAVRQQPPSWTAGDVAFWMLGTQGPNNLWVGRFGNASIGQRSPWERHVEGQELLHVLEGAVEVTLLLDSGPVTMRLDAGSIFLVPTGVWHSHTPWPKRSSSGPLPGPASIQQPPTRVARDEQAITRTGRFKDILPAGARL